MKVKLSLCPHYRRTGNAAITVLIPNLETKWTESSISRHGCLSAEEPLIVTTKQESGWAPGPVWGEENNLLSLLGIKPRFLGHQSRSDNTDYVTLVSLKHSDNCVLHRVLHDFCCSLIYRVQLSVAVPSSVTKLDYWGTGHFLSLGIMI